MVWLNAWQEDGFNPVHETWLERLVPNFSVNDISNEFKGEWIGLDEDGLALFKKDKNHFSLSLEDVNLK